MEVQAKTDRSPPWENVVLYPRCQVRKYSQTLKPAPPDLFWSGGESLTSTMTRNDPAHEILDAQTCRFPPTARTRECL